MSQCSLLICPVTAETEGEAVAALKEDAPAQVVFVCTKRGINVAKRAADAAGYDAEHYYIVVSKREKDLEQAAAQVLGGVTKRLSEIKD